MTPYQYEVELAFYKHKSLIEHAPLPDGQSTVICRDSHWERVENPEFNWKTHDYRVSKLTASERADRAVQVAKLRSTEDIKPFLKGFMAGYLEGLENSAG